MTRTPQPTRPVSGSSLGRSRAVGLACVALAAALTTVWLDVVDRSVFVPPDAMLERGWLTALTGLAQVLPGAMLLARLPRHPIAWLLSLWGLLWVFDGLASSWAIHALYASPGSAGASLAYWYYERFGSTLLLSLPLILLLFPDGRLAAERPWRQLSLLSLATTALLPAAVLLAPSDVMIRFHNDALPPEILRLSLDPVELALPYTVWEPILRVAYASIVVSLVVPFAVTVHRYRAAAGDGRAQLRWLMWAALVDMLTIAVLSDLPSPWSSVGLALAIGLTSGAIVVAVAKYRLYEIDRLLPATFLYALLAAATVLVDLALFASVGGVLGERDSALVALAVVAAVYVPMRSWLWRTVNRLVRGPARDPYATVAALATRLEEASDPDEQLRTVARTVAESFRLPYVRVEIMRPSGDRAWVEHGTRTGREISLPVSYRGERVGRLALCQTGNSDLSEKDQQLLGDLVRQAAAAARATELSSALQGIRSQLVVAREEERRRLRRDLHDSLGPSLGAVSLRIETARNLARTDVDAADRMLDAATAEVAEVIADVRRLVHDLRPPALDEVGLHRAIEQQADRFATQLDVVVQGDCSLPPLPAAVEVAAYRIVSEALTNVSKHARATRCTVSLSLVDGPALEVQVRDNGQGMAANTTAGVGMASLRERAAELGGSCTVTCPDSGGTLVRAVLPIDTVIGVIA